MASSSRYEMQAAAGKALIRSIELIMHPFLPDQHYFDPAEFEWTRPLEEKWEEVLSEAIAIRHSSVGLYDICDISPEQYKVVDRGDWDFFPLYAYGIPFSENLSKCPKTALLLSSIPNMTTAFFSILKPGTFVKLHRGAFRGYLRYHLGLQVPEPDQCGLRLTDQTYHWENGKSMIFDDTFIRTASSYMWTSYVPCRGYSWKYRSF